MQLCLDFLTALEASPGELAAIAAGHGIPYISLPVLPATDYQPRLNLIGDTPERREARGRCADLGVAVDLVECFRMTPDLVVASYEPAFESAAFLGARCVNVQTRDEDQARLRDNFGATCALAARYGLAVVSEISRRQQLKRLPEAASFLAQFPAQAPKVLLDTLHFCRFHGTADEVARFSGAIGRVQLADGPAEMPEDRQWAEAIGERLPPGEGELPLAAIIEALPADIVLGIEVPMDSRKAAGVSGAERARVAIEATKRLLARVGREG